MFKDAELQAIVNNCQNWQHNKIVPASMQDDIFSYRIHTILKNVSCSPGVSLNGDRRSQACLPYKLQGPARLIRLPWQGQFAKAD
jgi:hypothetical protein